MMIIHPSKRLQKANRKCMWQGAWPHAFIWVTYRYSEIIFAKHNIRIKIPNA